MIHRRNARITEMKKTVLSECQGLSDRGSPRLLQTLQPPFLQGAASLLLLAFSIDVATLLPGAVITFTSPSSVVSPPACRCISVIFVVGSNFDGRSIWRKDECKFFHYHFFSYTHFWVVIHSIIISDIFLPHDFFYNETKMKIKTKSKWTKISCALRVF